METKAEFYPLNGAIIFEEFSPTGDSRIIRPSSAEKDPDETFGIVTKVSDGWYNVMGVWLEHKLKPGDRILPPRRYLSWKKDGKTIGMCDEKDVLAKVELPATAGAN